MAFRWYGYKNWVFPEENGRKKRSIEDEKELGHS
jgi:hypothetical protein